MEVIYWEAVLMKELKINAVLNGFTVKVGCQTVVYTDIPTLVKDLREYFKDWDKKEKELVAGALNKRLAQDMPHTYRGVSGGGFSFLTVPGSEV